MSGISQAPGKVRKARSGGEVNRLVTYANGVFTLKAKIGGREEHSTLGETE